MIKIHELAELVATFQVPPIETVEDNVFGPLRFTIQIFKRFNQAGYFPRVLRAELVDLSIAYREKKEGLLERGTFEILVMDDNEDWESLSSDQIDDVINTVVARLNAMLGFDS